MKTYLLRVVAPLLALLLTVISCQKADDAAPASACKLARYVAADVGSQGSSTYEILYTYDAAGHLIDQRSQSLTTPKTGPKRSGTSRQTLVYDGAGFLTSQSNTYEGTEGGKTTVQSSKNTYDYANGRLVKDARRDIGTAGEVSNSSTAYEYDSNGKIAKLTSDSRGTLYIQTFTSGVLTKLLIRDVNGVETQPATINSQGLITKYVRGSTSYDTYEYDSQQRVVREEHWFNGKLNSYRLNEYDDKIAALYSAIPAFKGHPLVESSGKYNITRYTLYGLDGAGLIKKQGDTVYQYTYNAKGYPLEYTYSDAVSGLTGKVTFTLTDCG